MRSPARHRRRGRDTRGDRACPAPRACTSRRTGEGRRAHQSRAARQNAKSFEFEDLTAWWMIGRPRRAPFGSFGAVHVTGAACSLVSLATKRSFLCATIPTSVVTCFTTGSYRCGSGREALSATSVAQTILSSATALLRYDGGPVIRYCLGESEVARWLERKETNEPQRRRKAC